FTFNLFPHPVMSLYFSQYIVLNCPSVSSFENHPFTLTKVRPPNPDAFLTRD
ncbi:hypothetical protein GOODEAATRI_033639, partial [Goodea atripinnis]